MIAKSSNRIFIVGANMRSGRLGIDLVNEDEVRNGMVIFAADPWRRDLPTFTAEPILRHNPKHGRPPRDDLEQYRGYWLVSLRMKSVIEAVDPGACAFSRCVYLDKDGKDADERWICIVSRSIDALDVELSDARKSSAPPGKEHYAITRSARIVLSKEKIGDAHFFSIDTSPSYKVCDELFRQSCKNAGLRNMEFYEKDLV